MLRGTDPQAASAPLLGHIDVVEARRADWTRDPFTLVEENGDFHGRGSPPMKSIDAIWVDTMMRLKRSGKAPRGTLKLTLMPAAPCAEMANDISRAATVPPRAHRLGSPAAPP